MSGIFISYRRDDSGDQARALYQSLIRHFGPDSVGFDLELEPGVNYLEAIHQAVGSCDVLIAVIGPEWLKAADQAGRRRLDQEDDLVRREIKTALDRGIRVIPFLVNGARRRRGKCPKMPAKLELPEALYSLTDLQAVSEPDLEAGVKKLIPVLERVLGKPRETGTAAVTAGSEPKSQGVAAGSYPASDVDLGTATYLFTGHAIGAAAQFRRLDDIGNLNHVMSLASCAIAATGGFSRSNASNYLYTADFPRRRTLLSLRNADSIAAGRELEGGAETEVDARVESVSLFEKLYLDSASVHFRSRSDEKSDTPAVTTKGCRIEGLRLGTVIVRLEIDDELLAYCGSTAQLARFYQTQSSEYRRRYHWRFGAARESETLGASRGVLKCSLIRKIRLLGAEKQLMDLSVDGNQIVWRGFGRIILGEVVVDCVGPHGTMIRIAMGSDAEGVATICEGHCTQRIRQ